VQEWKSGIVVVAKYKFTATDIERTPKGRRMARHTRGKSGFIPDSYVQKCTGKPLTVVLLGKTGNGKSAAGNKIVGASDDAETFPTSDGAESETEFCRDGYGTINGRLITVIDTPGILDTNIVKKMHSWGAWLPAYREDQKKVLRELTNMYTKAPDGFDAIILVSKFGERFTAEDGEALKLLTAFMGKEAEGHMIMLFTRGDEAERNARKQKVSSVDDYVEQWLTRLPEWVKDFICRIGNRKVLFNNILDADENPEAYQKQRLQLIEVIDKMTEGKPFINSKTKAAKGIEEALNATGYKRDLQTLRKKVQDIDKDLQDPKLSPTGKRRLQECRAQLQQEINDKEEKERTKRKEIEDKVRTKIKGEIKDGGCYPGSAIFVDKHGRRRQMDSLEVGDEVQVIINNEIQAEPVIIFIHRQLEVMQEFLQIKTEKNNILKITEDHLLFVEKTGKATAIPARDVRVGDILYVRADHSVEKDAVLDISKVYEKGVYAPVTLSGTILVNDVHTSCYFDVLSHEWSHRAMGVVRAAHYVSPWILQWISGVGQKDGCPGWCRLAHKILTLSD